MVNFFFFQRTKLKGFNFTAEISVFFFSDPN